MRPITNRTGTYVRPALSGALFLGFVAAFAFPSFGSSQLFPDAPDLPPDEQLPSQRPIEGDIHAPERVSYRIAVAGFGGSEPLAQQATEVMRNDLKYSSCCQVIDSRSFPRGAEQEGLGVRRAAWTGIGAQAVVKGEVRANGDQVSVELRLYEVGQTDQASLTRTYSGRAAELRTFVHRFGNDVLAQLFQRPGAFDTQIAFARRIGPGRKDVMLADYDGAGARRLSSGQGVAMLPSFGQRSVWFSRLLPSGMYITNSGANDRQIVRSEGLNMGVSVCRGRIYFTSTRDGNSEIYSSALDGTRVRRLTNDPAIDVSPNCGPDGRVAFVSNRHGGPQVFVMNQSGGEVQRVTFRGYHNQTPSWCPDPSKPLLAFTGRDQSLDIFTVNLNTQQYTRITQAQGVNKDPAFSPDCRMIAFHSSRRGGGIYLSNPSGFNQNLVLEGHAETIDWSAEHMDL
jgi:TolB protein